MFNTVRILAWNINGGIDDMLGEPDIQAMVKSCDIAVLTETWKGPAYDVDFPGYLSKHFARGHRHKNAKRDSGGFLVLISEEHKRHITVHQKSEHIVWVTVRNVFNIANNIVHIGFIYIPPERSTYQIDGCYFDQLQNEITDKSASGRVMLCGDFNAHTGELEDFIRDIEVNDNQPITTHRFNKDTKVDLFGRLLIDLCKNTGLQILNGREPFARETTKFTCHRPAGKNKKEGKSTVDYLITCPDMAKHIKSFIVMDKRVDSDHCPLVFEVDGIKKQDAHTESKPIDAPRSYIWDPTKNDQYCAELESELHEEHYQHFLSCMTNDNSTSTEAVQCFNIFIRKTIEKNFKMKTRKNKSTFPVKPWFDEECKSLKRQANTARKSKLDPKYQQDVNKRFKRTVQLKKRRYQQNLAINVADMHVKNPNDFWKYLKKLRVKQTNIPDIDLETFTNHFKENSKPPQLPDFDYDFMDKLSNYINDYNDNTSLDRDDTVNDIINAPITVDELHLSLKKMKNRKACGVDSIPAEFYKYTGGIIDRPLIALFNYIFDSGEYPDSWSVGLINPLHKQSNKSDPKNYRKITLLSALGKVFESILNNRLCYCKTVLNVEDPLQNGFKPDAQTTDNLFILNAILEKYRALKRPVYVCFVDFKSAFDYVNRHALLYKLLQRGMGGKLFNILRDLFNKAKSRVKWNDTLGDLFENIYGVLQGGVISPSLFKLYLDDLRNYLDNKRGVFIGTYISHLLFADDLVLIAGTRAGLQSQLDGLGKYCRRWHLILNQSKTKVMVFNKQYEFCSNPEPFFFNDKIIDETDNYKYIGIKLKNTQQFLKGNFTFMKEKAMRAIMALKSYIRSAFGNNLPTSLYLKLFDQQIRPILEYGNEVWCPTKPVDELERVQLYYIKTVVGLNKQTSTHAVLGDTGRFPLHLRQQDSLIKYWCRIQTLNKDHILSIVYKDSYDLSLTGHDTWAGRTIKLIKDTTAALYADYNPQDKNTIERIQNESREFRYSKYIQSWNDEINDTTKNPKLRNYKLHKSTYSIEPYILYLDNKRYQRSIFRLRASSHRLQIELGRHTKPITPLIDRKCIFCKNGDIDDEVHFLINCNFHDMERKLLYENIGLSNSDKPDDLSNFIYVLSLKDKSSLNALGKFITDSFSKRELYRLCGDVACTDVKHRCT